MKIAIYPGSFDPWHEGHNDVLKKSLKVFDLVIIGVGMNPAKDKNYNNPHNNNGIFRIPDEIRDDKRVDVRVFSGLLVDFVNEVGATAVVRGLRNGVDLEYERTQQYWNEDLGIKIPTVCFITDRKLTHISSSAVRMVNKLKDSK